MAEENLPAVNPLTPRRTAALLEWFRLEGIDYPWGDNPTPYRVWISEIMLQQTVVTAAVEHYKRWMERFPDAAALAAADEQAVLKAWEGLGYYSRAVNLHKGAMYLMDEYDGKLPDTYDGLLKVPGIGDYTARAVLSLAFGRPRPVLDANVRRIGQRLFARAEWGKAEDKLWLAFLGDSIPREEPGSFNAALMQLGQLICRVGSPDCGRCPLREGCLAEQRNLQGDIPLKKKRVIREKRTVLFVLVREGQVLLVRRSRGIGRGLWFLPGADPENADHIRSRLASCSEAEGTLPSRTHLYTTWKDSLNPELYLVREDPGFSPEWGCSGPEDRICWIPLEKTDDYPSPSVYRRILTDLKGMEAEK